SPPFLFHGRRWWPAGSGRGLRRRRSNSRSRSHQNKVAESICSTPPLLISRPRPVIPGIVGFRLGGGELNKVVGSQSRPPTTIDFTPPTGDPPGKVSS